jgi:phosphopantothenoylcysteine decarboxylase/phosphopantothenate--cysteine ligase
MAKAANGLADDLLSTLYLAFPRKIIVAPAMNCEMWEKPAVQRNLKQLCDDGIEIVDPEEGWLSCRKLGVGRMAAPEKIVAAIQRAIGLANKTA